MEILYSHKHTAWYAMKTTFKRELRAKAILDSMGIESFVAMTQKSVVTAGRKRVVEVPVLHNLIFVCVDGDQLKSIKEQINYLHNRLTKDGEILRPIVVRDCDMEQFIALSTKSMEHLTYLDIENAPLNKGMRVRIIGGEFEGYEGVLTKVKGVRDKRVVVSVEGLVAVALAKIDKHLIEPIEDRVKAVL